MESFTFFSESALLSKCGKPRKTLWLQYFGSFDVNFAWFKADEEFFFILKIAITLEKIKQQTL